MQRQVAPPDPDLIFAPLAPPTPGFDPPVVRARRRARLETPGDAEVIPPTVRTSRGGLEMLDAPAPPMAVVPAPGAAVDPPVVELWPAPVPTFTYLAGAAGSGKTYATREWAEREKGLLLCATTGIAAINLGGETINSVLGYFDTQSMQESYLAGFLTAKLGKLWKVGVRRLVLDEVSMLAGDQLTYLVKAIEEVNGRGYVLGKWTDDDDAPPPAMGLTLVGDFLQLPPVKATYAFESPEWARFTEEGHTVTLTEIRRQADPAFIGMLRAARIGRGDVVVDYFQSLPGGGIEQETDDRFDGPTIVAKNEEVDRHNYLRMSALQGKPLRFLSSRWGKQRSEWGNPEKPPATWGIPQELPLKIGALVMILSNYRDPETRELRYVNGDLGTIVDATDRTAFVELQRTGEAVEVAPVERQVKVPADGARRKELRAKGEGDRIDAKWEVTGAITYLPLRVAYASTVHKSQGLSLDRVQVNIRDGFFKTPGMLYVALSRARTAEGLRLVGSPKALVERCVSDPRLRGWL
jgi:ATP-dependent DNA helicase PIF1